MCLWSNYSGVGDSKLMFWFYSEFQSFTFPGTGQWVCGWCVTNCSAGFRKAFKIYCSIQGVISLWLCLIFRLRLFFRNTLWGGSIFSMTSFNFSGPGHSQDSLSGGTWWLRGPNCQGLPCVGLQGDQSLPYSKKEMKCSQVCTYVFGIYFIHFPSQVL